jgi:hypothetical protein
MNAILDDENIKNKILEKVTTIFDEMFEKAKSLSKIDPNESIEKRWKRFDKTGLMWTINQVLQPFGWSLILYYDASGNAKWCIPEQCECYTFQDFIEEKAHVQKVIDYFDNRKKEAEEQLEYEQEVFDKMQEDSTRNLIDVCKKHAKKEKLSVTESIKNTYDTKVAPDECDLEACNCRCEGQKLQIKVPNNSIAQVAVTINKQLSWRVEEYHNCFVGICDLLHLAAQAATLDELKEEIEYTMHDLIEDLYLSGDLTEYAKAVDLDIKISESEALSKNINEDTLSVKFCVPYTLSF